MKFIKSAKYFSFIALSTAMTLSSNPCFASATPGDEDVLPSPAPSTAQPESIQEIEIDGKSQAMFWHILDLYRDPNSSLAHTDIVTYEDDVFKVVGTLLGSSEENPGAPAEYMNLIMEHNYTYLPYYRKKRIGNRYVDFGAILVGHTDPELAKTMKLAFGVFLICPFQNP